MCVVDIFVKDYREFQMLDFVMMNQAFHHHHDNKVLQPKRLPHSVPISERFMRA